MVAEAESIHVFGRDLNHYHYCELFGRSFADHELTQVRLFLSVSASNKDGSLL